MYFTTLTISCPPAVWNCTAPPSLFPSYKSLRSFCHSNYKCNTSTRAASQHSKSWALNTPRWKRIPCCPTRDIRQHSCYHSHTFWTTALQHLHLFWVLPLSPSQWKTTLTQHRAAQFVFACCHSQCSTSLMCLSGNAGRQQQRVRQLHHSSLAGGTCCSFPLT